MSILSVRCSAADACATPANARVKTTNLRISMVLSVIAINGCLRQLFLPGDAVLKQKNHREAHRRRRSDRIRFSTDIRPSNSQFGTHRLASHFPLD